MLTFLDDNDDDDDNDHSIDIYQLCYGLFLLIMQG